MFPKIIQGGMGVGVSGWDLASEVSSAGGVGTVSGTALTHLLVDALQKGDSDGCFRWALGFFPFPNMAREVLNKYFVDERVEQRRQVIIPRFGLNPLRELIALTICANFAFVKLAKEGHSGPVFINYLEKIQMPHIYSVIGAMLAGVDGIVMGAGIPSQVPGVIDAILSGEKVRYRIDVSGEKGDIVYMEFDPKEFFGERLPKMERPVFFPIVTSDTLATRLATRIIPGKIDGFIVEAPTAGGHNAPPRGQVVLNEKGEPVYGPRDEVDWKKMKELGIPFWIAGSVASPGALEKALELGASGIQVGTIFALCEESGFLPKIKLCIRQLWQEGRLEVKTNPTASPTGFPFKVAQVPGTLSESCLYESHKRGCSMGYLREVFRRDGKLILRCSAEPVGSFVTKGGDEINTLGRMCLCNALCGAVGANTETPVVTLGDDVSFLSKLPEKYTATDAIRYLLGK